MTGGEIEGGEGEEKSHENKMVRVVGWGGESQRIKQ